MQGQIFVFISFVTLTAAAASERVVQCSAVQCSAAFFLLVADMISMYLFT